VAIDFQIVVASFRTAFFQVPLTSDNRVRSDELERAIFATTVIAARVRNTVAIRADLKFAVCGATQDNPRRILGGCSRRGSSGETCGVRSRVRSGETCGERCGEGGGSGSGESSGFRSGVLGGVRGGRISRELGGRSSGVLGGFLGGGGSGELSGSLSGELGGRVRWVLGGVRGRSSRSQHALVVGVRGRAAGLAPVGGLAAASPAVVARITLVADTSSALVAAVGAVVTRVSGGGKRGELSGFRSGVLGGVRGGRIRGFRSGVLGGRISREVCGLWSGESRGFRSGVLGGRGSRFVGGELGGASRGMFGRSMRGGGSGELGGRGSGELGG